MAKKNETPSKSTLYGQAVRELRTRHAEEFDQIVTDIYAEHGLTYTRRLTPEERAERAAAEEKAKAEAALIRLVQRHPVLGETYASLVEATQGAPEGD